MDWTVWLALVGLFLAGGLTPGPAVMLVMSSSLRYGPRRALIPALGISAANLLWISLAATGVATLAASAPVLLLTVKLAGLGFILWLAWGMASANPDVPRANAKNAPLPGGLFARGVGLQLLNPNTLVFFGLLLPAYFDSSRNLLMQTLIIMASVTITEMLGLTIYAWIADAMNKRFQNPHFTLWFNRGAALLMVGAALFALVMTSAN